MLELGELKTWIFENKLLAAVVVFLLIFALGTGTLLLQTPTKLELGQAEKQYGGAPSESVGAAPGGETGGRTGEYVEVKEADFEIESENASKDASKIRSEASFMEGYIERSTKTDGNLYKTIELTARIPRKNFTSFLNYLDKNFEVESHDVENYHLSIEREVTELEILNQTLRDYEEMRSEVKKMENSEKKIELLVDITEKELWVKERQRYYQQQLGEKYEKGEYATFNIDLRERRIVDIWPENIGNRFNVELKEMMDTVTMTLINTATGGVEIFFMAIQWIIYLAIVLIPVALIYKVGKKVYEKYWKE